MLEARLVATVPAPLSPASADPPAVTGSLLVQRADTELVVDDLSGQRERRRFPAPWPRPFGSVAVSPDGELAVFAGVHALRAVGADGAVRWELRHGCWSAAMCTVAHVSFAEYAQDTSHFYADRGSAAFSSDGRLLWAHVRGDDADEQWLIVDAADGTVLARAATGTLGSGSAHVPHPDPASMGLTVAEDSPALWGHWDGDKLHVRRFDEEVLLGVSPSGTHLLTTDPEQSALHLHLSAGGAQVGRADADGAVPAPPGDDRARWDRVAAVPWDHTAVVGTEDYTDPPRHWLVELPSMTVRGPVGYPFAVCGPARAAATGIWYTVAADATAVHLWTSAGDGPRH
ncbi:hypothetical protein GCM10010168_23890 [Actinoplanes ianthinogenes]|uniref:Uncharacterized protein n=1 Tax=Actinoplanes ianthinogenes TaxID=122358 RepID=A0ABM7M8T0_9ACTN|nr:hypothetical protein [Actinoplanes ianthinogenes]BCJ48030.1 hypothetical protein Aiant_86870 [Actinoplanes ianthinogenes]GGR05879.1 hypothetical protein GCM10010168_23890 [Actinoplanes ianthinogenes]